MPEITVILSIEDFRRLVAGRAVETEVKIRGTQFWIRIGMKGLDFKAMVEGIRDAMDGMGHAPPDGEKQEQELPQGATPRSEGSDRGADRGDAAPTDPRGDRGPVQPEG